MDVLAYLRPACGLLFWHAIARALYALPPVEPFARRQEARATSWAIVLLVGLELC